MHALEIYAGRVGEWQLHYVIMSSSKTSTDLISGWKLIPSCRLIIIKTTIKPYLPHVCILNVVYIGLATFRRACESTRKTRVYISVSSSVRMATRLSVANELNFYTHVFLKYHSLYNPAWIKAKGRSALQMSRAIVRVLNAVSSTKAIILAFVAQ
jgi:hypothetical protein